MPRLPFTKAGKDSEPRFFSVYERLPLMLAALMGLQHCLAMIGGVITPSLVIYNVSVPADDPEFNPDVLQYLVSASLIVSGLCSIIQVLQIRIPLGKRFKPFVVGTGVISVMGTSFTFVPIALASIGIQRGEGASFESSYGKFIGTSMVCMLLEIGLSYVPPKVLRKMFPPIVSGVTVFLIGASLTGTGLKYWGGGSVCADVPDVLCTGNGDVQLPYGSAAYVGLGLTVYGLLVIIEIFGSPFMRNTQVIWALLTGYAVAAIATKDGQRFVTSDKIDSAPGITFLWTETFPLGFDGPTVLPLLIAVVVTTVESIGDITATEQASQLNTEDEEHQLRIQGGIRGDAINSILAGLAFSPPNTTFSQNNGVIALTRVASRWVGVSAALWLLTFGILAKIGAFFTTIPDCVLGGMTTFLFANVLVSGIKIISMTPLERRERFILAVSLGIGVGVTIVPGWANNNLWPVTEDMSATLKGFRDGIIILLETGYCIGSIIAAGLNGILPGAYDPNEPVKEAKKVDYDEDNGKPQAPEEAMVAA